MPRPPAAKDKIDEAAYKLFARDGVDATTTKLIAAEAGISEAAIYRHYPSKAALAAALFRDLHHELGVRLLRADAAHGNLSDKVRAVVEAYTAFADADFEKFRFHLLHMHVFLNRMEMGDANPVEAVETIVARGQAAGLVRAGDPTLLAAAILGIVLQPAYFKIYGRLSGALSDHADILHTLILGVLKPCES